MLGLVYRRRRRCRRREAADGVQSAAFAREAITHLERVATAPAADIALHYTLGRLYLRTGAPEKAVQALGRVLTQNPNSVQGRLDACAGVCGIEQPDRRRSRRSSEIVEDEPRVASALAQYQEQAGQLKEAAENYTRALASRR